MLTGNEIRIQIASGGLDVKPYDEACIGPNSYDVHLGDQLVVYTEAVLDAKQENRTRTITIPEDGIVLHPGRLYLGKTVGEITSTYCGKYQGQRGIQASKLYEDFEEEAEKMKYWDNITAINDRQGQDHREQFAPERDAWGLYVWTPKSAVYF